MPRVIGTRCGVNSTCTGLAGDVPERLLHLGGVAVGEQAVGVDVLVRLGEEAGGLQAPARARHARHRVDHDAGRLDQAGARAAAPARATRSSGSNPATPRAARRRSRRGRARAARTRTASSSVGRGVRLAVPLLVRRRPAAGSRRRGRRRGRRCRRGRRRSPATRRAAGARKATSRPARSAGVDRLVGEALVGGGRATGTARPPRRPAFESAVTWATSISGWPARRRRSSAPVYPDPPTTAARYAMEQYTQMCISMRPSLSQTRGGCRLEDVRGHVLVNADGFG